MNLPTEQEILKKIETLNVTKRSAQNRINLAAVGKVNYAKISSGKFIFTIKTSMKKFIKSIMYFLYKIFKKPLNSFLRIVEPTLYQSSQEIMTLRSENKLLKDKLQNVR